MELDRVRAPLCASRVIGKSFSERGLALGYPVHEASRDPHAIPQQARIRRLLDGCIHDRRIPANRATSLDLMIWIDVGKYWIPMGMREQRRWFTGRSTKKRANYRELLRGYCCLNDLPIYEIRFVDWGWCAERQCVLLSCWWPFRLGAPGSPHLVRSLAKSASTSAAPTFHALGTGAFTRRRTHCLSILEKYAHD